jgi:hypothetical protein
LQAKAFDAINSAWLHVKGVKPMPVAIILLAALASTQTVAQPPQGEPQRIIVTGVRIQDYRDRLAACLARHCPTNEDADATLALAEAYFLEGQYADGRAAVRSSLNRNARNARNFPEPVSDLYRAHARLSEHLGLYPDARRSSYGVLRALREGIPTEDYRHFTARLELSERMMGEGDFRTAKHELEELIRVARAAGREDVAIVAELRILWFEDIVDRQSSARSRLTEMSQLTAPADRFRSIGAKLVLARIYRTENQDARADALLAEVGRAANGTRRRLIHSPRYELQVQNHTRVRDTVDSGAGVGPMAGANFEVTNVLSELSDNFEDKWIDVGFWIMPDGHVAGFEILRHHNNTDWADPMLASLRGRVYSAGPEPTYRLERYTYTARYEQRTGSHIARRTRDAHVEYLDLTTSGDAPGPPPTEETPSR